MYKIHILITKLPRIIVWYWFLCIIFLKDTDFYYQNFHIIDAVDSLIVGIITIHFLFYRKMYSKKIIYIICIYFICLLYFLYFCMSQELYYFLYYFILLTFLIASFWKSKTHTS